MSQFVANFTGETIYLDTMILYEFLRTEEEQVIALFKRIEAGEITAHTSVLTIDEVSYRMMLAFIKDQTGGSALDQLRRDKTKWIQSIYPQLQPQLQRMQGFPNLHLTAVETDDLTRMHNAVRQYQLMPRNALHFAAMQKVNCLNIVSEDGDFDRIPHVQRYTLRPPAS